MLKAFFTGSSSDADGLTRAQREDQLLQAVADNEVQALQEFLARGGCPVKIRNAERRNLVHVAAFECAEDCLAMLLRVPTVIEKIDSRDRAKRTPLHLAAAIGDKVSVQMLVAACAAINLQDEWGCTPLHLAIKFEQVEASQRLLDLAANPLVYDLKGLTAVDLARESKVPEVSAVLMSVEPRKRHSTLSALRCLFPTWGKRGGGAKYVPEQQQRHMQQQLQQMQEEDQEQQLLREAEREELRKQEQQQRLREQREMEQVQKFEMLMQLQWQHQEVAAALEAATEEDAPGELLMELKWQEQQLAAAVAAATEAAKEAAAADLEAEGAHASDVGAAPDEAIQAAEVDDREQNPGSSVPEAAESIQGVQVAGQETFPPPPPTRTLPTESGLQGGDSPDGSEAQEEAVEVNTTTSVDQATTAPAEVAAEPVAVAETRPPPAAPTTVEEAEAPVARTAADVSELQIEWFGLEPTYTCEPESVVKHAGEAAHPPQTHECIEDVGGGVGALSSADESEKDEYSEHMRRLKAIDDSARMQQMKDVSDEGSSSDREDLPPAGHQSGAGVWEEDDALQHGQSGEQETDMEAACYFQVFFEEGVQRLEFEVLWDGELPCVGGVKPGGAAEERGIASGDVVIACNDAPTAGRTREELLPFLKMRPLALQMYRAQAA
eukprot:gnl/TRDRNA2_/TRDRNA2_137368_c0_seq1.p1 gnl/TRDRNA2_/TRDRNA2_137368_c0~~gnl/TRDRNA2_/TRDRNA2_137368_c0_seq1.p1  ORF type:complete len:665 (+),score=177.36 gnl/TRDRNA2_/TRDRNA2_137368_c0_seq1:130-2124(+)